MKIIVPRELREKEFDDQGKTQVITSLLDGYKRDFDQYIYEQEKTRDIISHHMWPVGGSRPPRSLEAVIVSAADKLAAVEDFFRGYEEKRPGIKGVIRELGNRKKE